MVLSLQNYSFLNKRQSINEKKWHFSFYLQTAKLNISTLEFNYSIAELNNNILAFNYKQVFIKQSWIAGLPQSNLENSAKRSAYQQYMLTIAS